jgi:LacI family transcriptional regulator
LTKGISIVDVAREAGVSIATASRVINKSSHPVSEATALRVLKAVERLGYSPSALARALVSQHSGIIGVLVGDNADPYFAAIVRGIHTAARQHGYLIIVCNTLRCAEMELDYVSLLTQYRADGILFVSGALMDSHHTEALTALVDRYRKRGGHIVALTEHFLNAPRISVDNRKASYDMTAFLIGLGHRRIGYVRGPANLRTALLREEGFCDALLDAGLPLRGECVVDGDFTFEGGSAAMNRLLDLPERPTAVFAANDMAAIGCVVAAQQRGLHVPQDVSVAGMDDIQPALFVNPPLTTVSVPMTDMGAQAASLLFELVAGQEVPEATIMPHALIVRGTTGPPPVP